MGKIILHAENTPKFTTKKPYRPFNVPPKIKYIFI